MRCFNYKKRNYEAAICPKCGGNLEVDGNFKRGFCKECGVQVIIDNKSSNFINKSNESDLNKVISFIERHESIARQDKYEQNIKKEIKQKENKELIKKYWWILPLLLGLFFIFIFIMSFIGNGV